MTDVPSVYPAVWQSVHAPVTAKWLLGSIEAPQNPVVAVLGMTMPVAM
jgi:hypothetical protein